MGRDLIPYDATPPLRWWQGWRISWNPWPMVGAAVIVIAGLLLRGG